ncbi:hypothetical protein AAOGI_41190 [Agarivorans albus]
MRFDSVLRLVLCLTFFLCIPSYASSVPAKVYDAGNNEYYLASHPITIILHGEVATPIVADVLKEFHRFYESDGFWYSEAISEAEWKALGLTNPTNEFSVEQIDFNQAGKDDFLLRSSTTSLVIAGDKDLTEVDNALTSAQVEDLGRGYSFGDKPSSVSQLAAAKYGEFSVSPSGAATYHYPFTLPEGVNGFTPKLSLNYSSQSGDSIAGIGWSIGGVSKIYRCGKNKVQDGENWSNRVFNNNSDRLCLDGQRLVLSGKSPGEQVSDADYWATNKTYYPEVDNGMSVRVMGLHSNASYFKVTTRSNEVWLYGNGSAASRISHNGVPTIWAIAQRVDKFGNIIQFGYQSPSAGEQLLSFVGYGNNESYESNNRDDFPYKIDFTYRSRPKSTYGYRGGAVVSKTKLLNAVSVTVDDINDVSYELGYETSVNSAKHSRLTFVQECHELDSCLAPTSFDWYRKAGSVSADSQIAETKLKMNNWEIFDMDGDGKADLVYLGDDNKWYFKKSTTGSPVYINAKGSQIWKIDANRDGILDALIGTPANKENPLTLFGHSHYHLAYFPKENNCSTAQGWACVEHTTSYSNTSTVKTGKLTVVDKALTGFNVEAVADYDFDGFDEVVGYKFSFFGSKTLANGYKLEAISSSSNEVIAGFLQDDSGQGTLTKAVSKPYGSVESCRQEGGGENGNYECTYLPAKLIFDGVTVTASGSTQIKYVVDDISGDGLKDVAYYFSGDKYFRYRLSNGGVNNTYKDENTFDLGYEIQNLYFSDLNNDGLPDLFAKLKLSNTKSEWRIYFGESSSKTDSGIKYATVNWSLHQTLLNNKTYNAVRFSDVNGNGFKEIIAFNKDGYSTISLNQSGDKLDAIKTITYGYKSDYKSIAINYGAINTDDVSYVYGGNAGNSDWIEPLGNIYLVNDVAKPAQDGSKVKYLYRYHGLRYEPMGRGWLGFETFSAINTKTNIENKRRFYQEFPYIGRVRESSETLLNSSLNAKSVLSESFFTYNTKSGAPTNVVYLESKLTKDYHLSDSSTGGLAKSTTYTANGVNIYGGVYKSTTVEEFKDNDETITTTRALSFYPQIYARHHLPVSITTSKVSNKASLNGASSSITRKTTRSYNANLALEEETTNHGTDQALTIGYEYDLYGNVSKEFSSSNIEDTQTTAPVELVARTYAKNGRYLASETYPYGLSNTYQYNGKSAVATYGPIRSIKVTDANQLSEQQRFDALGRVISHTSKQGVGTNIEYQLCSSLCNNGVLTQTTQTTGEPTQTVTYNAFAKPVRTSTQSFSGTVNITSSYDWRGKLATESLPNSNNVRSYQYDVFGRLIKQTEPTDKGLKSNAWSYNGATVAHTDANNYSSTKTKTLDGRLISASDKKGVETEYAYNAFGQLTHTRVNNDAKTDIKVEYDSAGNKTSLIDPSKGSWSYTYNKFALLSGQTDANGKNTTFKYDNLGRKLEEKNTDGKSCFIYHTSGTNTGYLDKEIRLTNANTACSANATGQEQSAKYSYKLGRVSSQTTTIGNSSYSVDYNYAAASNKLDKVTYPSNGSQRLQVKYAYQNGYLKTITDLNANKVLKSFNGYDSWGKPTKVSYSNGVTLTQSSNPHNGRMASINLSHSNQTLLSGDYSYNARQLLEERWLDFGVYAYFYDGFEYDANSQITDVFRNMQPIHSITYDELGNIKQQEHRRTGTYAYNDANPYQLNSHRTGGVTSAYSYDKNGNVTKTGTRTLSYYSFDKLKHVVKSQHSSTFAYDANHMRYQRKDTTPDGSQYTTHYVAGIYDKVSVSNSTSQTVTNGVTHNYYIDDMVVTQRSGKVLGKTLNSQDTYYQHKDDLGNVLGVTNGAGKLIACYSYEPFGAQHNECKDDSAVSLAVLEPTRYGFTGHEMMNDVGLIHMNGRIYDQASGRFLQADFYIPHPTQPTSFNRYVYAMNNPLNVIDPNGYWDTWNDTGHHGDPDGPHAPGNDGWKNDSDYQANVQQQEDGSFKIAEEMAKAHPNPINEFANFLFDEFINPVPDLVDAAKNLLEGDVESAALSMVGIVAKRVKAVGKVVDKAAGVVEDAGEITVNLVKNAEKYVSRRAAFRAAKRDAGIPTSQTHISHEPNLKADSLDSRRTATEYDFGNDRKVQNHPEGHTFRDGGKYESSHFNNHGNGHTNKHYEY